MLRVETAGPAPVRHQQVALVEHVVRELDQKQRAYADAADEEPRRLLPIGVAHPAIHSHDGVELAAKLGQQRGGRRGPATRHLARVARERIEFGGSGGVARKGAVEHLAEVHRDGARHVREHVPGPKAEVGSDALPIRSVEACQRSVEARVKPVGEAEPVGAGEAGEVAHTP